MKFDLINHFDTHRSSQTLIVIQMYTCSKETQMTFIRFLYNFLLLFPFDLFILRAFHEKS